MLVFAFEDTIAARVLRVMEAPVRKVFVVSNIAAIDDFIDALPDDDFVIGLGMYSGVDSSKIRIETRCDSRFRNTGTHDKWVSISGFLRPTKTCVFATGIGNSWCNYISFRAAQKTTPQRYGFVHIPKSFAVEDAAAVLDRQLSAILEPSR